MPVYMATIRQCRTVWEKATIIVHATNEDLIVEAIQAETMDETNLEWQEQMSERNDPGLMCDKDEIYPDDRVQDIDRIVTIDSSTGEPAIIDMKPISSVRLQEIADSIDHDNITLIEAIRAVINGVYKLDPLENDH